MKEAILDYCWETKQKPSPFLVDIIDQIIENPQKYRDTAGFNAGLNYISIYVTEEKWLRASAIANAQGQSLGVMIRAGMAAVLAHNNIPWHGSSARIQVRNMPDQE